MVFREGYLGDVIVGQAIHLRVIFCIALHLIVLDFAVRTDAEDAFSHGSKPYISPLVAFDVESANVFQLLDVQRMVIATAVEYTDSILVSSYPDAPFEVLAYPQDGSLWNVMPQAAFSVGSELVDAVLVGSYPDMIVLVDEHAGGAVVTNQVMVARTKAHVAEVVKTLWLHEHAFLHHAEPDVALLVFDDVLHLALR